MTSHLNWQESLNPQLLQRLVRPLVQPGVISSKMAQSIVQRSQRFANRLPMLKIADRGSATSNSNVESVPIVYAQPQPVLANSAARNLESNLQPLVSGDSRASQSEESRSSSQPIVVQAKFASPSSPASMPVNASEKLTGLIDIQPPQSENIPFIALDSPPTNTPSESLPIVPVQNLISNTGSNARIASNVSPIDRTQIDTREPAIVQAKFDSPSSPASMPVNRSKKLTGSTDIQLPQSENIPFIALGSPPTNTPSESLPIVQAKFVSPDTPSNLDGEGGRQDLARFPNIKLLANAEDLTPQSPALRGVGEGSQLIDRQEIPIVYLHSKPAEEVNPQMSDSTTNEIAAIPLSTISSTISSKDRSQLLPKVFAIPGTLNPSPELQEPLVFTQPQATPQSEAKSTAQSDESSYLSHPDLGESDRQISNSQVSNFNLLHSNQPENHSNQPVNIDALADKIERKLMRKLIVENERRGRRSWS